jgi:hypothetical protein
MDLLSEEVRDGMTAALGRPLSAEESAAVDYLVHACARHEPDEPIDQGLERIEIKKDAQWVPASGKSVKPGNLRFNLGKLFEVVVSGIGVAAGAAVHPILAVLSGLVAVRSLVGAASVELKETEALVIWALWRVEQDGGKREPEKVLEYASREAERVGDSRRMSLAQVEASLMVLEKIRAVRHKGEEWSTTETVVVKT